MLDMADAVESKVIKHALSYWLGVGEFRIACLSVLPSQLKGVTCMTYAVQVATAI